MLIEIDAPPTGGQKSTKIEKLYQVILLKIIYLLKEIIITLFLF